jgi:hypothetical protein
MRSSGRNLEHRSEQSRALLLARTLAGRQGCHGGRQAQGHCHGTIEQGQAERVHRLDPECARQSQDQGTGQKDFKRFGYPPDLQEEAVKKLLMKAELLCR